MNSLQPTEPLSSSQQKQNEENEVAGFVFKTFELLGVQIHLTLD